MTVKKNWFFYLSLVLFEVCAVYALFCIITDMGREKAYPFLWYGGMICVLAAALAFIHAASRLASRLNITIINPEERKSIILERIVVGAVILTSAIFRIWTIAKIPIAPSSDYQTYYQVAQLLSQGTLSSSGYSGYIAEFPHVIGFPFVLSIIFRITGPSLAAGLSVNLAASLASVYLTYRVARILCGRLCGIIALFAAAFWPSQILYGTILASEPIFTCILLLCIRLFIYLYRYPVTLGNREGSMFLCFTLGVLTALANAIRPLSEILLIAMLISMIPFVIRFNRNEQMLNGKLSRASCQGWFMALVVLFSFFIFSRLISASISNTIAYKLPGGSVSYGYNLMLGVNIDAKGAWNQQDADFFASEFAKTNSAEAAHKASIAVALQRIKSDPFGVANLAVEKTAYLFQNDDYGATWTTLFLGQQGNLTPERQNIITTLSDWNDYFYLLSVFFSAVFGFGSLKRNGTGPAQALILLIIGTTILHMILESQNRYHYFLLPVFMILASIGITEIYRGYTRSKAKES